MIVKPFRGWRPVPELADKIASFPYDVISSAEAREIAAGNPYSFLHVVKPEIDLDPSVDPADDAVYAQARHNVHSMIEKGWLVRDESAAYYVYRLTMDEHQQIGVVGASAVEDYLENRIKKHEHTRPPKVEDRLKLNDAISMHPGPVMLAYRALPEINAVVRGCVSSEPDVSFGASDGVTHELWAVDDKTAVAQLSGLFEQVRESYIADGHHRAEAAARVSRMRSELHPDAGSEAACRYFLTVLFPADQLRVFDYNRVVRDLNGLSPQSFLDRVAAAGFDVEADYRAKRPAHRESFGLYLDGKWSLLTARPELAESADVAERLDVSILTRTLLGPVLGVGDLRTDSRIDFVGGIRGMKGLEARVDGGEFDVAFACYPTSLESVMQVADAGKVMPPKSTWFEPKLRSGLVAQSLDGDSL